MNYSQNGRIAQVTETTLVVGVDVGSTTHYARAFDWRGNETGKSVCRFENNREGFDKFNEWMKFTAKRTYADRIIVGAEPTGHYWFGLDAYLAENDIKLVMVNPYHVKQSKEMDDNSQTKNDRKDPKVIAKLVTEGRYREPYMPKGIYADLRTATAERQEIMNSLIRLTTGAMTKVGGTQAEYAGSTQAGTQAEYQPITVNLDIKRLNELLDFCIDPRTRDEMQDFCGIKTREYFRKKIWFRLFS